MYSAFGVRSGVVTEMLIKFKFPWSFRRFDWQLSENISKAQRPFETSVIIFMIPRMERVHLIHVFSLIKCILINQKLNWLKRCLNTTLLYRFEILSSKVAFLDVPALNPVPESNVNEAVP
jgi:hypothetical protein